MTTGKRKVLIVEDEVLHAFSLEVALKAAGYEVCELSATGEKAISIVTKSVPDIIIMDINLSGDIDGLVTAKCIRETREVPILFLTGYSDQKMAQEIANIKGTALVSKPADPTEIEEKLEQLINGEKL